MTEFDYLKKYDLCRKIRLLAKKYKGKKVVIYGAGKLSDYVFNNYDLSKLNIVAVVDKKFDSEKDIEFHGIKGITPDGLKNISTDGVIIFNLKSKSIIKYFVSNMKNIKIDWILEQDLFDYIRNKIKYGTPQKKPDKKYIFTFWEPQSKIPDYIKFCMQTWKKFLPEYEIVVLNYDNLDDWIGYGFYNTYLYENFSLQKQADAVRAILLYLYGGVWFDADTIVTSEKIKNIINQNTSVMMFNTHLGFICAKKKAKVLKKWIKGIKKNIYIHKFYKQKILPYTNICKDKILSYIDNWDYLGNLIIDKIVKSSSSKDFMSLERMDYFALPENNYYQNIELSPIEKYIKFYFENDFSKYVYENEKGIICLHNSWTPNEYKNMKKEEFLNQNPTISKVLKEYIK